jgi:uncharacterized RmlC-like cupin family protein
MAEQRDEVVVVRAPAAERAKQGMPVFFGVSADSVGAKGLCMHLTEFPPAGESEPHMHRGHETAVFGVSGAVQIFYGERLEHSVVVGRGEFAYIPPGVPHKACNLSATEKALFVTARDDAREQENVVPTPEADAGSGNRGSGRPGPRGG